MTLLLCPVHDEDVCPPDCEAMREWRALQEKYRLFWRDRGTGVKPWDKHKHGYPTRSQRDVHRLAS